MSKITETGNNLIFLISQPRAGSTLTQKILGCHSKIYTISEPWIMLHPLYALKYPGYQAEYQSDLAFEGLENTLNILPDGKNVYFTGVREMYSRIYNSLLSTTPKEYFLDKTPRYYHIIPELYTTFPSAKYIILLRNPLAVLGSILETWVYPQSKDNLQLLRSYLFDLLKAPISLLESIQQLEEKICVIHYENLLMNPSQEMKVVFDFLRIKFENQIIQYGNQQNSSFSDLTQKWHFGDQQQVNKQIQPNADNLDNWINRLENPYTWQLLNDYLQFLGEGIIEKMGYSYSSFQNIIEEKKPEFIQKNVKLSEIFPELEIFKQWKNKSIIFLGKRQQNSQVETSLSEHLIGSEHNIIQLNNLINDQKDIIQGQKEEIEELYNIIQRKDLHIEKAAEILENTHAELVTNQNKLGQTQVELNQIKWRLNDTQGKLNHTQGVLAHTQEQLNHTQNKLAQTQGQLTETQDKLDETQAQLNQSNGIIRGMESSKFWQLRNKWFALKAKLGIKEDE